MRIKNLFKYLFRFLSLQVILTLITIYYFDNFLIWDENFKYEIYLNLIEDKNRFFPFIDDIFITVDGVLTLLIFIFLLIIYSTNFYTYVNELSFSMNRNLLGEYFQIYLLWTSYLMVSFFILRFNNLFRGSLLLFSFLIHTTINSIASCFFDLPTNRALCSLCLTSDCCCFDIIFIINFSF